MNWFWIAVVVVLILVYAIIEGVGTLLIAWIFSWGELGIALTYHYIKTRITLGQTAAVERCQQVRAEHQVLLAARKEQDRQADAKAAEWQRKHPVVFWAVIGLPVCFIAGFEAWKARLERQKQETRVILNHLADEALAQMENGGIPSSGRLADQDVWGSAIEQTFNEQAGLRSVFLRSSGRDCQFQTPDDLIESRRLLPTALESAGRLIDRGVDKLRDKAKGLLEKQRPE